jgi:hypothetical protein
MARIWCCRAQVSLGKPLGVRGYPQSTGISVNVKVRTETEREPSDQSILDSARRMIDKCYDVVVLSVHSPRTEFLLWDNI